MADMMDTLKDLLGDDAENKIKTVMDMLKGDGKSEDNNSFDLSKLQDIGNILSAPDDERSRLLLSLKPFMRSSRQKGIDSAVKLLTLSKFSGLF